MISSKRRRFIELLERGSTFTAAVATVLTILSLFMTVREWRKADDLVAQVTRVDDALTAIKGLERNLAVVKADLLKTAEEKKKIEDEWQRAQALQALTKDQYAAMRAAMSERSLWLIIGDNVWAFLLGVASSLLASYFWARFSRSQRSEEPNKIKSPEPTAPSGRGSA